jgi:hypothetical protein
VSKDGEGCATGPEAESAQAAVAKQRYRREGAIRVLYVMGCTPSEIKPSCPTCRDRWCRCARTY